MAAADGMLVNGDILSSLLFDWLDAAKDDDDRETLQAIFDVAGRLAEDAFLPHHRQADIEEPRLDADGVKILPAIHDALAQFRELGFFGASFSTEMSGLGLSSLGSSAVYSIFASANLASVAYAMLTAANARLLTVFGTEKQRASFALPQIEGRWFGTMCLSEPQAGSGLGDIRTRAVPEGEDEYGPRHRLTGNKMWISGGDQDASENIVHLVLAKVARPDGTLPVGSKGISLFIVPKILPDGTRNDVAVAGLNHKLGYRGTANCLLNFGENGGAIGWRVGEEGQGLAQMFMMMNEARISVGTGAAALAYRGYRQSLRYAQERVQGRSLAAPQAPDPVAIIEHPDVRRMLLQQRVYAEGALALCFYCSNLVDQDSEEAEALLALLTPVAKSWPSEFGLVANDLAIQVHGGYGYTRDFDVEQLWRDNRLNPIHEGTTGIQALDLLRRKLLLSDGKAFELLLGRIRATAQAASGDDRLSPMAGELLSYWDRVKSLIGRGRAVEPGLIAEATMLLRAFGHGVVAWLWLDQAVVATRRPTKRDTQHACAFFFRTELPQALGWLTIVEQAADSSPAIPEAALS